MRKNYTDEEIAESCIFPYEPSKKQRAAIAKALQKIRKDHEKK